MMIAARLTISGGMATKHFDVEFPKEMEAAPWSTTKFRLVKVSNEWVDDRRR